MTTKHQNCKTVKPHLPKWNKTMKAQRKTCYGRWILLPIWVFLRRNETKEQSTFTSVCRRRRTMCQQVDSSLVTSRSQRSPVSNRLDLPDITQHTRWLTASNTMSLCRPNHKTLGFANCERRMCSVQFRYSFSLFGCSSVSATLLCVRRTEVAKFQTVLNYSFAHRTKSEVKCEVRPTVIEIYFSDR